MKHARKTYDKVVVPALLLAATLCIAAILRGQEKSTTSTNEATAVVTAGAGKLRPTAFTIMEADRKPIITIYLNGHIEWRDGMTPEQAAQEFADALQNYVGMKWGCRTEGKPQPQAQLLNDPSYQCRFLYWRGGAILKTGEWSSGYCAESLLAMDMYNATTVPVGQPEVSVSVEIRIVGKTKLNWGETERKQDKP